MSKAKKSVLKVTMPDGSVWGVPVSVIAASRAAYYAPEFGGDLERSLKEDTLPLFAEDDYEVADWAANNMNWSDVSAVAKLISSGSVDFEDGWANGEKEVV